MNRPNLHKVLNCGGKSARHRFWTALDFQTPIDASKCSCSSFVALAILAAKVLRFHSLVLFFQNLPIKTHILSIFPPSFLVSIAIHIKMCKCSGRLSMNHLRSAAHDSRITEAPHEPRRGERWRVRCSVFDVRCSMFRPRMAHGTLSRSHALRSYTLRALPSAAIP